jgi:carboxymethylenebutenolidase
MVEQEIEVEAGDGRAEAVLLHDEATPRPGVLIFTDIHGIRPASLQLARRLAARGWTVLVPNVFYRTARLPIWAARPDMTDEKSRQRFGELTAPLTPEAMERDGAAYVDHLAASPATAPGGMAVVGYCFTGAMALRTAAARPDRILAAASFHGGGLWTAAPTSPHLVLPCVKARLYFGHAEEDRTMPAPAIAELDRALAAWGGRYASETYPGARHGWTMEDSPIYNPEQADRAFTHLADLLAATL